MKNTRKKNQKGFTLIELMAVVTIFAIMTAVGLGDFKGFQSKIRLENLAYDVALLLRQSQNYGIAVVDQNVFDPLSPSGSGGVGVHFTHEDGGVFASEIVLFQDIGDREGYYDTAVDRLIDTARLGTGAMIANICVVEVSGCDNITDDISITFTRPSPEPTVKRSLGAGLEELGNSVQINLKDSVSGDDVTIYVQISPTGQISVGS